ncbi:TonB-dependent siderophore receptor [Piscinibacter sakaiensis]|uniref:TonB-dependent siderophore receptor n=1 Tax=Piscinibacter sakaiensis TaxID=1547922 RepID=UPI003AADD5C7
MPCPTHHAFRTTAISAAACLLLGSAFAQTATPTTRLETVTITSRNEPLPAVGGWNLPLGQLPFQAGIVSAETLRDIGATRLSDITRVDPAVSDAYNTEGYWDYLTLRGFVIDNRFNYRRDGLPINAETSIPLGNKERVEVLKGTSGLQAGTSAPGGLVNLVVKRPLDLPLRSVELGWREKGSVRGAVDISQRFGNEQVFGLRVNAVAEKLDPQVRNASGEKHLLALAGDWRIGSGTLIEAEIEHSRQSQPSVPAFSMLGNAVPAPVDPRINLNNQPWSLPVVLAGNTGSLRLTQRLTDNWRATAHLASQQLRSDDRIAFPFGCFDAATGTYYGDRYCPNGDFDLYDFRSDNERRRSDSLELAVHGKLQTGAVTHQLSAGALRNVVRHRFEKLAFNPVGTGNVNGRVTTPADPSLTSDNTNRDESSTELFVRDSIALTPRLTAWLGARHSRIERSSIRTDGSEALSYRQSFTTPWLAASYSISQGTMVYASHGHGIESDAVANRARYTNRGQALPALRSRQTEVGIKGSNNGNGAGSGLSWGIAAFDISRPAYGDFGVDCFSDAVPGTCTRRSDGDAVHRGIELEAGWHGGPWMVQASAQWLHARRHGSADPSVNGKRPTNVPAATLKLLARYDVAAIPGLSIDGGLVAESDRMVLPDNSARIAGHGRIDAGLRFVQTTPNARLLWRAGVDNLFDRRAWRESPYQFSHAYLFPMAPRTFRVSVEALL